LKKEIIDFFENSESYKIFFKKYLDAMNKFVEIVNIKTDNNEFIKNLIPSLALKN